MQSFFTQSGLGFAGLVLSFSSFSPLFAETEPPVPIVIAQSTTNQCQALRDSMIPTWLERSRVYAQNNQLPESAEAFSRALQLLGQPNARQKMEFLRLITEDSSTAILQSLVAESVRLEQRSRSPISSIFPPILAMAQSLPTDYSAVKTQALTQIAKHYITLDRPEEAVIILEQAKAAATFLQGAEFQTKALTAIARIYGSIGDKPQAIALLEKSLGYAQQVEHPNPLRPIFALEAIAVTYAQLDELDAGLRVDELVKKLDPSNVFVRDEVINLLVKQAVTPNQIEAILPWTKKLSNGEQQAIALAKLAGKFDRAGQMPRAEKLLNQAIALAKIPAKPVVRNATLAAVTTTYGEASGNTTTVLPIIDLITEPYVQAQTLRALADIETDPEKIVALTNRAIITAKQVTDPYAYSGLINSFVMGYISTQRWAIALDLINRLPEAESPIYTDRYSITKEIALGAVKTGDLAIALQATESLPELFSEYRNEGFQSVAVGYATQGNFTEAMAIFPRVTNDGSYPYQVTTLAAIAAQARLQGDNARAEALLTQAMAIAKSLSNSYQQSYALATLSIQYDKLGQQKLAADLRKQAAAATAADYSPDYALQQLIPLYMEAGEYKIALQTAIALPRINEDQSWILNTIAREMVESGTLDIALAAVNAMEIPADKTSFLLELTSNYISNGNFDAGLSTLAQAFAVVKIIPGKEENILVFRTPPDQTKVDDPRDRGSLLEAIALKYAEIGQIDQAQQVAATLESPTLRNGLLSTIACYRDVR